MKCLCHRLLRSFLLRTSCVRARSVHTPQQKRWSLFRIHQDAHILHDAFILPDCFLFFCGMYWVSFFFGPLFICRGSEHSYWKCHAKAKMWSFNFEADIYLVKSKSKATKWRRKLPKRERKKCARWMKMCTVVILAQFQCQASAWNCLVRFFLCSFHSKTHSLHLLDFDAKHQLSCNGPKKKNANCIDWINGIFPKRQTSAGDFFIGALHFFILPVLTHQFN